MSIVNIESGKYGFSILRDRKKSKWSMTIGSMVPMHKRTKLSDYYIIVRENDKIVDRVYIDNGEAKWVHDAVNLPIYVRELAEYIMLTGDVNKYFIGKNKIDNKFVRIGVASIH